jgi:hypothetical protein
MSNLSEKDFDRITGLANSSGEIFAWFISLLKISSKSYNAGNT